MMTTANDLAALVAVRCHDSGYKETPNAVVADYLAFVNDAVDDWNACGGLAYLSDAATLQVADTYDYTIPALFVYLWDVYVETETGRYEQVLKDFWYVAYRTGATAEVHIRRSSGFAPDATLHIMMAGQGRQAHLAGGDTVLPDMLAYLRERGVYHALEYLAEGGGSLAASRRIAASNAVQLSAAMEVKMPRKFRAQQGGTYIPGR
jgi:hypothetical protein